MIPKAEFAKAMAQNEQEQNRRQVQFGKILRIATDLQNLVEQMGERDKKYYDRTAELLKENADLRLRVTSLQKELTDQTMRANRMERELQVQVQRSQMEIEDYRQKMNIFISHSYPIAAEDSFEDRQYKNMYGEKTERKIPMATVLSFGSTRMTEDAVQTLMDLLYFALSDRTPEEDKSIKKMMTDFRKAQRLQMNVKDSTQNFYMNNNG